MEDDISFHPAGELFFVFFFPLFNMTEWPRLARLGRLVSLLL